MKWWFGDDAEDDLPTPKLNGEHGVIWQAIKFVAKGQRRIHTRLARLEVLMALGVLIGLAILTAQVT